MTRLTNKVALITGATGGIGLATSRLFVAEGARVVLVDINRDALEAAVAEIGADRATYVVADVSDPIATQAYVKHALQTYGRIDVYFSNAGIEGAITSIVDYPLEIFDRVFAVNVRGVWLGLKYVIPAMTTTGGGSIVITSSLGGLRGAQKLAPYVGSKHAVVGLMRSAALECAPLNIRVNTINPSPIATRMIESIEQGLAPGATEKIKARITSTIPMRRYGQPEEVARLALFLASDESSYCSGTTFSIDGGMSAN